MTLDIMQKIKVSRHVRIVYRGTDVINLHNKPFPHWPKSLLMIFKHRPHSVFLSEIRSVNRQVAWSKLKHTPDRFYFVILKYPSSAMVCVNNFLVFGSLYERNKLYHEARRIHISNSSSDSSACRFTVSFNSGISKSRYNYESDTREHAHTLPHLPLIKRR